MRPFWVGPMTLLAAACAQPAAPPPHPSPPQTSSVLGPVNPANIKRVGRELPPAYEVTSGIPSGASPRVIWRLEAGATSKPPQCATLADPGNGRDQSAQGVSGSGPGGIVD